MKSTALVKGKLPVCVYVRERKRASSGLLVLWELRGMSKYNLH